VRVFGPTGVAASWDGAEKAAKSRSFIGFGIGLAERVSAPIGSRHFRQSPIIACRSMR
jgi:hypothetical protein